MKNLLCCILLFILIGESKSQSFRDIISEEEKIYGLSKIWSELTYNFAFIDRINFDVDSLYKATIPKVLAARDNEEYINTLREFLYNFENNKTFVWNSQWMYDETDNPVILFDRSIECCVVERVEESLVEKIPPKSIVISVDGKSPTANLRGEKNTAVALEIITPEGDTIVEAVVRNWSKRIRNGEQLKLFPPFENNSSSKFGYEEIDGYSIVTLNTFGDSIVVDNFRDKISKINNTKGLIIDVRKNGGGNSKNAKNIAIHLVDRNFIVGPSWKTRIHNAAKKAFGGSRHQGFETDPIVLKNQDYHNNVAFEINPPDTTEINKGIDKVEVPIVILQSNQTISAAEDFLIYTMNNPNIKRIGQKSKGNSGQPLSFDLSNGVAISIVAKRDALPNGDDYIGIGIKPDVEISKNEDALIYAINKLNQK
jgi:C-terminal processing protease CtpA/Prc